jgi:hypothetical protein
MQARVSGKIKRRDEEKRNNDIEILSSRLLQGFKKFIKKKLT